MLIISLVWLQVTSALTGGWETVERVSVPWVEGVGSYELSIEQHVGSPDHRADSARVRIRVPGRPDFVFVNDTNPYPFRALDELTVLNKEVLRFPYRLRSRYAILTNALLGKRRPPVLLLVGDGGEDPDPLIIIALDKTGYPVTIFYAELAVTELRDLDGDGLPELVGNATYAEGLGKCTASYDPYSVFKIVRTATPRVSYDIALSKSYNEAHYVWAGPHFDPKWKVDHCTHGKYRLRPMNR